MLAYEEAIRQVTRKNIQHVALTLLSASDNVRGSLISSHVVWLGIVALRRILNKVKEEIMDIYLCVDTKEACEALEMVCAPELGDPIEHDFSYLHGEEDKHASEEANEGPKLDKSERDALQQRMHFLAQEIEKPMSPQAMAPKANDGSPTDDATALIFPIESRDSSDSSYKAGESSEDEASDKSVSRV